MTQAEALTLAADVIRAQRKN